MERVWCGLGRAEGGLRASARRLGNGWVRFPRRTATLWAQPWTPPRLGGVGTNPEYAMKSTDRFLTSLIRIRVEIEDQRKVALLKLPGAAAELFRKAAEPRSFHTLHGLAAGRRSCKYGRAQGQMNQGTQYPSEESQKQTQSA